MKNFKFVNCEETYLLSRDELKLVFGGSTNGTDQYNCSGSVPGQIGACRGKGERSSCSFSYTYYPNRTSYDSGSCMRVGTCPDLLCL